MKNRVKTIGLVLLLITSLLISSCGIFGGGDDDDDDPPAQSGSVDSTAPTIVSRTPTPDETDVPLTESITVEFSEAMNETTINESTFKLFLKNGGDCSTSISGTVAYDTVMFTASFIPDDGTLTNSTDYLVEITEDVHDAAGNAIAGDPVKWYFTTSTSLLPPCLDDLPSI